ncbi:hypothetical protein C8R46DRAFT_1115599 [Mycena filopes]|nr:hypothetical protein C8R46DRAFT_1115599 [Mycena filopes]
MGQEVEIENSSGPSAIDTTSLPVSSADSSNTQPASTASSSSASSSRVKTVALDESSGAVVAYDSNGQSLDPQDGPQDSPDGLRGSLSMSAAATTDNATTVNTCRPATDDELSTIPGWSKFIEGVTNWSGGQAPQSTYVNNTDSRWGISVCYATDTIQLTVDGDPSCSDTDIVTKGNSTGTDLGMEAAVTVGTSTSYTTTTEESSRFSWSTSISVDAEFEIASASVQETVSLETTNTKGSQSSQTQNSQVTRTANWTNKDGRTCVVTQNEKDCTTKTTGQVDLYLTGFIWMSFKTWFRDPGCSQDLIQPGKACEGKTKKDLDKCYDANSCPNHGHYGNMVETYVPDQADRSNPLKFSNSLSTKSISDYSATCLNSTSETSSSAVATQG